jgi:hypothetical protein
MLWLLTYRRAGLVELGAVLQWTDDSSVCQSRAAHLPVHELLPVGKTMQGALSVILTCSCLSFGIAGVRRISTCMQLGDIPALTVHGCIWITEPAW